ncbi:MAG: protein kinase [Anaerolineales bacterium]|nr:protein kinase [Anaerolineales bacterium]
MTLRVHLLGPSQISRNDVPVEVPGYRPLALLAYLLLTGKAHSRQHLVDLLFDNPDDPKAALRWTLSKLRSAIGAEYLLADRHEVAFNFQSDFWLDISAFEAGQLDLYRGDFLEGLHLRDAYRFEDWAFFERERLRAAYQAALEQRLVEAEGRKENLAVVEFAHQLLRLDNLREDWYCTLMGAYAHLGQREAALAQFELCRQVLQAELGVEPVAETMTLAEAIRRGDFQPARLTPDPNRDLIAGRFTIDDLARDLLGQGGMGAVYRGRDTHTDEIVAIKVIKSDLVASRPDLLQRFIREGEALRRLNHPNIIKLLAATENESQHYLVMEYVEGGSLRDLLQSQGHLPINRVLEIALDLADALTRAHRLNIIHRDLKPENVLLAKDGTPRIADFGIAQISDSPPLTQTGLVLGTLDYISPEACQGESLDARTDIWAFGVMLYELLTGQRPFTGETLAATLTAILTQPVPDLFQQRPDTPPALADIIHRMLEKEPQQRIATVRLVGTKLEAILKGWGTDIISPPFRAPRPLAPLLHFHTSLVGRVVEMATLRRIWQKAKAGAGQVILVEGEPGIGKTRLIEELLAQTGPDALVLRAKCPELSEPLAYTLFVDPLRTALAGERPPTLSDTWLAEVSRLLPELRDRYPNLPRPTPLEAAAERRRLFDAICTTLLAWIQQRPLVLFVDDLQWADATSLALLNHFSAQIITAPVLLIGACRPYEVGPQHLWQELRRDWTRSGLLTTLGLQPLSDQAVSDLLRELTTWSGTDPSFGALIYKETGGNPLFVVETIASLRDEGRLPQNTTDWQRDFKAETVTIPTQVQTIIEARLNRLDDLSRQIITSAAVMRSSFEAEMVQEVSGRNEWETLEGLEHLLAGGLLVEQGGDRFTFSHDKIREVAYASLSQLRRKLLHRRVAEILEKQHRGREKMAAARLAFHYEQAGMTEKALDYYLQAGHLDREQYAYESTIAHYQKAVTLLKKQGDDEQATRILMQLGLLYHNIFDFQGAHQAYEEGFALERQSGWKTSAASLPPAPHALRTVEGEPSFVDPGLAADGYSINIAGQLFSGLVTEGRDGEVVPDVAKSWEILEEGRKYIFHLRDDVYWSDGRQVTAADFEYAWKRALHPATGSEEAKLLDDIKGARAFHQGDVVQPESVGVSAVDKHTLAVMLEEPTGYFLHLLTQPITFPVPHHVVEAYGEAWTAAEHIVSNGPFKLAAWKQGEAMTLARNMAYHGPFRGNAERVELWFGLDQAAVWAMYERGHLDLAYLPFLPEDQAWRSHTGECLSIPIPRTFYLSFDMRYPPFSDVRVRQALILATDRGRWAGSHLEIFGSPARGGFIPAGMPGHSATIGLPYDPTQARRLLAEAGYPEGRDFPVVDWLVAEDLELLADELQAQWQQNLGIQVSRKTTPWGTPKERIEAERPSLLFWGWIADVPDPDNFLRIELQKHLRGWRNETYDMLIEEARYSVNQRQRIELYRQADRILIEKAAVMPVTYGRWDMLVKPWVKRYTYTPTWRPVWKEVIIEPH